MSEASAEIGLIGLAVMGQNLVLNMADHGFRVAVYNRTTAKTEAFVREIRAREPSAERVEPHADLAAFVAAIRSPRVVILLVKSTAVLPADRDAVDQTLDGLRPLLEPGDVVVDCGNSNWNATIRRERELRDSGLHFVGSGISGGELGARFGPSLMPGGSPEAWRALEPIWKAVAAKVDPASGKPLEDYAPGRPITRGEPCTTHVGADGAGHYVKMVHNGIEYIDMQLIGEAYWLMRRLLGMQPDEMSGVFAQWNRGDLDSFLIQITADLLQQRDPDDPSGKTFLVDRILDAAGQKGTGKWTSISALDLGIPANAIAEAVFARCLSALKEERVAASAQLEGPAEAAPPARGERAERVAAIRDALYCSKICAYAQGFQLMAEAQREYGWSLDFGEIARIFRGGCIIRARFLQKITEAYGRDPGLANLMLDPYFKGELHRGQGAWRRVVSEAALRGIPVPAFMASLAYFDGYRSAVLPANLLQGQRDYFGAHTFERTDRPRGERFHVDWPEPGRPMREVS